VVRALLSRLILASAALPAAAAAQPVAEHAPVQAPADALAEDAREYARTHDVSLAEALRRLRAQEESVAATDRLQQIYRHRLAGISIEHRPEFRIIVLLTGGEPVPDQAFLAGGTTLPVVFRTGAPATRDQLVSALRANQAVIRSAHPRTQGVGVDQRTGELVLLLNAGTADRAELPAMEAELEALTGVPVSVRLLDRADVDLGIEGGARVEGVDPANGRRYACTTGFVVTDGERTGVVTAAHCPDALTYYDPAGGQIPLTFVGGWGARHQDVQVHVGTPAEQPLFYADGAKKVARPVTGQRTLSGTRAGEAVCRRGETSGYSCSSVELTDFAPPGDLCGGPCEPVWLTVAGPSCRGGDSGGPIFSGTIAFGITKGGSYDRTGRCNFYYYMSTDFLPDGWSLLLAPVSSADRAGARPPTLPRPER